MEVEHFDNTMHEETDNGDRPVIKFSLKALADQDGHLAIQAAPSTKVHVIIVHDGDSLSEINARLAEWALLGSPVHTP